MRNILILFVLLFATWLLLSGVFSILYLVTGVISCLIAVIFYRTIYTDKISGITGLFIRMCGYLLWLIKEITISSFNTGLKMWKLDPEISPQVLWLPHNLDNDVGVAIYANSITLTPGTVAIGTEKNMVYVHSLTEDNMEKLKAGNLLKRVGKISQVEKK